MSYDFVARNRRAVAGGFAVLFAAFGTWVWWMQHHQDPIVGESLVQGTVRRVAPRPGAGAAPALQVELPDGRRVVVDFGPTPPRDGEAVTLQAFRHASGEVVYFLPREGRGGR